MVGLFAEETKVLSDEERALEWIEAQRIKAQHLIPGDESWSRIVRGLKAIVQKAQVLDVIITELKDVLIRKSDYHQHATWAHQIIYNRIVELLILPKPKSALDELEEAVKSFETTRDCGKWIKREELLATIARLRAERKE